MIYYKASFESPEQLDDVLWSGARDRWINATDEQRELVFQRLEEFSNDCDPEMVPLSLMDINDFIWFDCDDVFFPDEE